MNNNQAFVLIGLLALLGFDLLTVAARYGLSRANLARLLQLREQMEIQISRTLNIVTSPPRPRLALSIFHSILRFSIAGLSLVFVPWDQTTEALLIAAGVLLLSALILAWLEWMIEMLTSRNLEMLLLRLTPFIQFVNIIFTPLVLVFIALTREYSESQESGSIVTEDDLKTLVDAGEQEGILEQGEGKMIISIFQLGDTLVREIMVPRIDIIAVELSTPLPMAIDALLESGFTRVPVFEETVDNVVGLLYAKDLLKVWREGNSEEMSLSGLFREAYFVPEAKKVDELLAELQSRRVHMAVVVDEYGGVAGLVTLEDIIEEIFGEIQDEYDEEELPYQVLDGGDYLFQGRMDLDDFNDIMSCNLPKDEADTLSGFIYRRLGHVPTAGESVQEGGLLLTVEQVSGRRIRKVRAEQLPVDEEQTNAE